MADDTPTAGLAQPVLAGLVAAIVGFASTFAVVLAGLRAVGATPAQAASGLLALCVLMGLVAIGLGLRTRVPITVAWSTPGAALLVSAGHIDGGFAAAVGAFMLCGALIVLSGFVRPLAAAIAAIPAPIAAAMLAGVLLPLCVKPVEAVADLPWLAGPVVLTWAVLMRFARPWAVPGALAAAIVAILIDRPVHLAGSLLPQVTATSPSLSAGAVFGLAIPLFVVTMASQNLPGLAVMANFGYRPPLRPILTATGAATMAGAPFGAHAVNLAAITAALCAGPEAHPDPARRWVASVSNGAFYVALGVAAPLATAFIAASPVLVIEAVAGLALLGALAASLAAATAEEGLREAAIVTFVVAASGITVLSVSSAFWGLAAGLAFRFAVGRRRPA
ncbi:MAG: benzoate/H(+) symporter BenE family transporter [Solirubrobacteraceae bacterium]